MTSKTKIFNRWCSMFNGYLTAHKDSLIIVDSKLLKWNVDCMHIIFFETEKLLNSYWTSCCYVTIKAGPGSPGRGIVSTLSSAARAASFSESVLMNHCLLASKSRLSTSREKKVLSPFFHCEIFYLPTDTFKKLCWNACNQEQIDFEVPRLLQALMCV